MSETVPYAAPYGTERSKDLFDRLAERMPGANTRTAAYYAPFPVGIDRGDGAWVTDLDGNRLIDLLNNYTSLVHGHAAPEITRAIVNAAHYGTVFPAPVVGQLELAHRLCSRVASVEQVRFTNSGTEAGMHAVRCARAATGRSDIVKAREGYHGSWDGLPSSPADARGVPGAVLDTIHWVDFNDADELTAVMDRHGERVAAIVLEPMLGCAVIGGDPAFFAAARAAADRWGALLVLDEVVTFRLRHDGYQARLGVTPDLTTFGKVIGGGLPIGAFGGRADLMALYDPRTADGVSHHGTFNGGTLTMAAGVASLDLLTADEIARINALGARLAAGLRELVTRHEIDGCVTEDGSLVQLHLGVPRVPRTGADLNPASPLLARFHRAALDAGVYIAPRGELNVTTAMDELLVDAALDRLDAALGRITKGHHHAP